MSASGRGACHSPERARARIMSAFVFSVGPDKRRYVDRTRTPVSQGATLSGWPTPLPVIPAISRTTNGLSLGHSCPGCGVGQTVEDAPGERTARCSMASSGSLGPGFLRLTELRCSLADGARPRRWRPRTNERRKRRRPRLRQDLSDRPPLPSRWRRGARFSPVQVNRQSSFIAGRSTPRRAFPRWAPTSTRRTPASRARSDSRGTSRVALRRARADSRAPAAHLP
jgi:hypothetical protein